MAGAYTALPAAEVPIDWPANWNPNWSFPGPPFPGGYVPYYTLVYGSDTSIAPGSATTETWAFISDTAGTDPTNYITAEPSGSIIFSATLNGSLLQLALSGHDYTDSVSVNYSPIGEFYGVEPALIFNISDSNVGQTIVLTAVANPFPAMTQYYNPSGTELTQTSDIAIVVQKPKYDQIVAVAQFTFPGDGSGGGSFQLHSDRLIGGAYIGGYANYVNDPVYGQTITGTTTTISHNDTTHTITMTMYPVASTPLVPGDKIVTVYLDGDSGTSQTVGVFTTKYYTGGVLKQTKSHTFTFTSLDGNTFSYCNWLTYTVSNGTIVESDVLLRYS